MGINIYAIAFLLSIVLLIMLILVGHKQNIAYYIMMFTLITISNMGYYTVSCTQNLETAIMGHRMVYLGGTIVPFILFICCLKLCHIKFPKVITTLLFAFSIVVLYFGCSVGHRDDYYKNISLGEENGMTYLIKEYGPMHKLYIIFLFGSIALTLGVLIYSLFKNNVSKKVSFWLMFADIFTMLMYVFKRASGTELELIALAYIFDEIVIVMLIRKIGMYEVSESIAHSLSEHSNYGYMVFDNKGRYMGCNETALKYLPEIGNLKIDKKLSKDDAPVLFDKIGENLEEFTKEKEHTDSCECYIKTGNEDRIIKCSLKNLYYGVHEREVGHIIELTDYTQQQKYLDLLNNYNSRLEEEVRNKTEHISVLQDKMVLGMADMIENRDSNTGGHIKRTSSVIRIFTKELVKKEKDYGCTRQFLNLVAKAAPMHDLGKIAVDDKILRKPGKYTPEEYEEMKKHSQKGAEIVAKLLDGVEEEEFTRVAVNVAHYHHEKWDGSGYPCGLSGLDIPLEARIMALADVFDALVSKRCYKEKMDYDTAFRIIEESLGSHFDAELGKMFIKCRPLLEAYYDMVQSEED